LATFKRNPRSLDVIAAGFKKALGPPSSTVAAAVLRNGFLERSLLDLGL